LFFGLQWHYGWLAFVQVSSLTPKRCLGFFCFRARWFCTQSWVMAV
jgi:hypothetical protein